MTSTIEFADDDPIDEQKRLADATRKAEAALISAQPLVIARFVDHRAPWPQIALLKLNHVPARGDQVLLQTSTGKASYRVEFVNFDPYQDVQITIGASPPGAPTQTDQKAQLDALRESQLKIFDKATAYTNAIIVVGYAGALAIWNFSKDKLSHTASSVIAILLGLSLVVFISWELFSMILRANASHRFLRRIEAGPEHYFAHLQSYLQEDQVSDLRNARLWRIVLFPTVGLGYFASWPAPEKWSSLMYGFAPWRRTAACQGSAIRRRRSSPSYGRSMCWSRKAKRSPRRYERSRSPR